MDKLFDFLLSQANWEYARRKLGSSEKVLEIAPEVRPQIQSSQVISVLYVLCAKIESLKNEIETLKVKKGA